MSEAHARAWWADVEHLQEAAERRSAERAKARIEGRDPVALTPLRPLHAVEGLAVFDEALDAVHPLASGEAPPTRRFARDGARAAWSAPPGLSHTGTLTLVRGEDDPGADAEPRPDQRPVRFTRRRAEDGVS